MDTDIPFDARTLHFRLEGSSDQESAVLVLLTDMHIWDSAISLLKQEIPNVRFLRYGEWRHGLALLSRYGELPCVNQIVAVVIETRLAAGPFSHRCWLGWRNGLAFASRYPDRLDRFVACDFNVASTKRQVSEWDSRLHYGKTYGMSGVLANKVVATWLTADSRGSPEWKSVRETVGSWSLDEFEATAKAQYSYDETENMRSIQIPSLFVVGSEDGTLPEVMSAFPDKMRIGVSTCKEIRRSGHLPMRENASAFVIALTSFLAGTIAAND
ncbi:hypothetical protein V1517DRAFT_356861 [Lipomyces orientalis]|uniref:Uncharacterized protein n=1 Tax=Lipomyces orientalis TaxID=1233043 RepID=A0ACC3TG81_9ASCO